MHPTAVWCFENAENKRATYLFGTASRLRSIDNLLHFSWLLQHSIPSQRHLQKSATQFNVWEIISETRKYLYIFISEKKTTHSTLIHLRFFIYAHLQGLRMNPHRNNNELANIQTIHSKLSSKQSYLPLPIAAAHGRQQLEHYKPTAHAVLTPISPIDKPRALNSIYTESKRME